MKKKHHIDFQILTLDMVNFQLKSQIVKRIMLIKSKLYELLSPKTKSSNQYLPFYLLLFGNYINFPSGLLYTSDQRLEIMASRTSFLFTIFLAFPLLITHLSARPRAKAANHDLLNTVCSTTQNPLFCLKASFDDVKMLRDRQKITCIFKIQNATRLRMVYTDNSSLLTLSKT